MRHIIVVCTSNVISMAIGCFIWMNISFVILLIVVSSFVISAGILRKMLVFGINKIMFNFYL
jgi:hypothetical protein